MSREARKIFADMVRARKAQIAEEEAEQSGGGGWTP